MELNLSESYLCGLLAGKGLINKSNLSINFPFNNEYVYSIAYCDKCNYMASATKGSSETKLKCTNKSCSAYNKNVIDPNKKKKYHQPDMFRNSLKNSIIPFLKEGIDTDINLLSSSSSCVLNLSDNGTLINKISEIFGTEKSFSFFEIPKIFDNESNSNKRELVNGLLDSCGYANAGSWFPATGKKGTGRMRIYFQIVNRNYKLAVSIDNFLRSHFKIPIQTVDWGHPNIRDGNLKDYLAGKKAAFGREHQVKIFAEYLKQFSFKISSKQAMFTDLINHNEKCLFSSDEKTDWFPEEIKPIKINKVKATHPNENSKKIPREVRCHFDAAWQINAALGCKFANKIMGQAQDAKFFLKTGILEDCHNKNEILEEMKNTSNALKTKNISKKKEVNILNSQNIKSSKFNEKDTYPILTAWLESYLEDKGIHSFVYDTSSQTLPNFFNEIPDDVLTIKIEAFEDIQIRPDVVAYIPESEDFIFVESKITTLGLKDLGQLLAYCAVGNPKEAILVSTKNFSPTLINIVSSIPDILNYGRNKKIKLGLLDYKMKKVSFPLNE